MWKSITQFLSFLFTYKEKFASTPDTLKLSG